jgi:hypothetical protein
MPFLILSLIIFPSVLLLKQNSVAVVRKRTIPTERKPLPVEGVGCSVQRIPTAFNLGFFDRNRYFFIQVALQLTSRGWGNPVPDPLLLRKSGRAGNRTRDLWICSQKLWPVDHRGGLSTSTQHLIFFTWILSLFLIVKAVTYVLFCCMICMRRLKSEVKTEHWEGPYIIQPFCPFSAQSSSVVENISDDIGSSYNRLQGKDRKRQSTSKWTKNWLLERNFLSTTNVLRELRLDPGGRFCYLRMDEPT